MQGQVKLVQGTLRTGRGQISKRVRSNLGQISNGKVQISKGLWEISKGTG